MALNKPQSNQPTAIQSPDILQITLRRDRLQSNRMPVHSEVSPAKLNRVRPPSKTAIRVLFTKQIIKNRGAASPFCPRPGCPPQHIQKPNLHKQTVHSDTRWETWTVSNTPPPRGLEAGEGGAEEKKEITQADNIPNTEETTFFSIGKKNNPRLIPEMSRQGEEKKTTTPLSTEIQGNRERL